MTAELREFIVEHFSRDELMTFCADYFRDFYEDYESSAITKTALARDLVEHCQRRSQLNVLRANLQKMRTASYIEKFGRLNISPVTARPRNPRQVFLSYSTHDLDFAKRLAADLRAEGVPVWAAFDSIQPGEAWTSAIDRGLSESGIYLVALTPNAVSSQWVKAEVQFAIQEQQSGAGRLVPLMIQPCNVRQLSALLTTIQHVEYALGYEQGLAGTFEVLGLRNAADQIRQTIGQRDAEAARIQREQLEAQRAQEAAAQKRIADERKRQQELEDQRVRQSGSNHSKGIPSSSTKQAPAISRRTLLVGGGLALAGLGAATLVPRLLNAPQPTTQPTAQPTARPTAQPTARPTALAIPFAAALIEELAPGVTMQFVHVPEGEFLMGSDPKRDPDARADEWPQHTVFLSAFYIGKYEVTNAQYAVFARDMQQVFAVPSGKHYHPVNIVSWDDATEFAAWLSQKTGKRYALPTEAQWEKAARGTDGRIYPWGDIFDKNKANTSESGNGSTKPVGSYSTQGDSPYGAADMSGNVWEWTADWYDASLFDESLYASRASGTAKDPTGPSSGQHRVLRGGSWFDSLGDVRAASRRASAPYNRIENCGFRVVRAPVP